MDKDAVQTAIKNFLQSDLTTNALNLFKMLAYDVSRSNPLAEKSFSYLKDNFPLPENFNDEKALVNEWNYFDILFQLSNSEISNQNELWDNKQVDNKIIESYLFAVIELKKEEYTRTCLAQVCREVNKIFPMPVMVLFRYGKYITLSVIDRRINKQRSDKDVLEKVTLIKNISVENPHRAHIEILASLSFEELKNRYPVTNFAELHSAWQKTLDTKELNERFYKDLYNWYEWAVTLSHFPSGNAKKPHILDKTNKDEEKEIRKNLIRLITRLIFVWFIKQKGLIPDNIFTVNALQKILVDFAPQDDASGNYYNAVIQNLFFATLNREIGEGKKGREFAEDTKEQHNKQYMIKFYFRDDKEKSFFKISHKEFVDEFSIVPFLNGGLFECLDYIKDPESEKRTPICVDGFSRDALRRARLPNILFFGIAKNKKGIEREEGIINIFNRYVFTIEENTPIDQDIALDPELLGRVFENLLATYNPETHESARNDTGSFYTPREIVEYMADTSLKEYFKNKLTTDHTDHTDIDEKLDALISYSDEPHGFDDAEKYALIDAIDKCKILDPACGSGAFPMGVLHKLVYILRKLDPENIIWRKLQKGKAEAEINKALDIEDKKARMKKLDEIDEVFQNKLSDYGRKLYLIENCIYGIDVQTIAIQISKLRFFISLVVDQKIDDAKKNRGIIPLPNLETKFVAANTLIGLERKQGGALANEEIEKTQKLLADVRHKHFLPKNVEEKNLLRAEDEHLRIKLSALLREDGFMNSYNAEQCAAWNPYNQNASADFFDAEWMFGVKDGFDVVIGNPPYVSVEKIDKSIKDKINLFNLAYQKYDLYVLFFEKIIELLKRNGELTLITSNKYLSQGYGLLLRKELLNYYIHSIINFNYDVFESATVRTCILNLQKINKSNKNMKIINILSEKDKNKFFKLDFTLLDQGMFLLTDENNFRINLTNEKLVVLNKIKEKTINIEEIFSVNYGLRPSSEKLGLKKNSFIYKSNPNNHFKKYFEGKDMGKWLINSFSYLDYQPDAMYNSMFDELFENEKLVGIRTLSDINKLRFIYDNKGHYCNDSVVILTLWHLFKNVKNKTIKKNISTNRIETSKKFSYSFVQGILNSKLIKFYVDELLYDGTHFYPNHIKSLPIKNVNAREQAPIATLVDKILTAKATDPQADTSALEREIDALVYRLYDLSYEEVKVIEPVFSMGRVEYEGIGEGSIKA